MILPIPTQSFPEDAVKFISLKKYEIRRPAGGLSSAEGRQPRAETGNDILKVGRVICRLIQPTIKEFARLDKQFRLPDGVWGKLPQYKDFGFAVFKLKKPEKGEQKVHPMAFEFPRAEKSILFFPTVHIHDGTVPAKAKFDHSLFCQVGDVPPMGWEESPGLADSFVKTKETQGIVDGSSHVYRKLMKGSYENKDVGVSA